ncbi:MAG: hypothetical protein H6942_00240 [Candidatus Accumulibacter sp.]|uniref:hypothetical protein n=1 Tax=Accumulibacter sp. TaxID=2053492 RepID=UPI0019F08A69|nr:hypothetical protein [Accumulibacter sp.]MBE2258655.1 hypothetical protein [Paracoccaceae bacterium]MCB1942059.1 hypothetical protein [Accumulibacter sp.]MCP5246969.1 hypothetical protein [Accumulibacter sp.]
MSSRQDRQRNNAQQRSLIASLAARLMAEDGVTEPALAKRKAARRLGVPASAPMPDDREVDAELRTYQRLFQDREQRQRNLHLLRVAARMMAAVQRFNPYLSGPVLEGTAGRYSEIDIQLFTDSAKEVEIFLLNERIDYRHSLPRSDRAEAVLTVFDDDALVNLVVYPRDEERVSVRTRDGRVREHARLEVVNKLLASSASDR